MQCHCCDREIGSARKVKLRPWVAFDPKVAGPDSPADQSYEEEMTFRWAVVCQGCYTTLDNEAGLGEVSGKLWNLAGASGGDKATTIDEKK